MIKNSVLFVDDDIDILSSLKRGLIDEEYKAFFATSGEKALAIMEENEISVIVTDMRMPIMNGLELLKVIKERYPLTIKIILSGYTQLQQILATINQVDIFKFITKPWDLEEEFKIIIRQAVEYYNLLKEKEKHKEALEKRNVMYQNILKSTDEKFLQNKNDLENIKVISKHIINSLKEQAGNNNNSEMLKSIQLIEELYLEYIKALPTNIIDFEPAKLESDLNKWLSEQKLTNRINIKKEIDTSIMLRGNYVLIFYVVTSLLKQLLPYIEDKGLDLSVDVNDSTLTVLMTVCRVEVLQAAVINSINMDTLISFLNEICETIGCTMVVQKHNEHPSIELKIPTQSL
jgi:CheY-like chemotaxis protein